MDRYGMAYTNDNFNLTHNYKYRFDCWKILLKLNYNASIKYHIT